MKIKKIFEILIIILVLGYANNNRAEELNQIGTSVANFLKIGVGARATGMGGAFVAVSDDISSLYWNPGGLGFLKQNEMIFEVNQWIAGTQLYYFGGSYNAGNYGVFGISLYSFSSGDMEETTVYQPEGTGTEFSANSMAAAATYSRVFSDRFSAGVSLKYISETLHRESASAIAIDVGSIFITNFFNDMKIGFALSNLGNRMHMDGTDLYFQYLAEPGTKYVAASLGTEEWDIPLLFRLGLATNIFESEHFRVTSALEILDSRDYIHRINCGSEIAINEMIFLRGGYNFNSDEKDFTAGAGLNLQSFSKLNLSIDYAYENFGILQQVQRFSITMRY